VAQYDAGKDVVANRGSIAMRPAFQVLFAVVLIFLPYSATAADLLVDGVPIPKDAKVKIESDSTGEAHRRFVGAWIGAWGGQLKHILIVEDVKPDGSASVVYAWGDSPRLNIQRGWKRHSGIITGDTLVVEANFKAEYMLTSATTARGSWQRGDRRSQASLTKTELSALTRPNAKIAWGEAEFLMIDTTLNESGKTVRLEVVLYKPAGPGPFPLFVFNHGSTGRGDRPELFRNTWWSESLAQFFVARGWMVAFPQRRGRGKSDGRYDEGFTPDRSRYACNTNQSLQGAQRALVDIAAAIAVLRKRPDVQPGPLLIGGQSRGGILSVAYAGTHPEQIKGVINFVGGWVSSRCSVAAHVNGTLFRKGGKHPGAMLWLYGHNDSFYPLTHSKANFAAFESAGGRGTFVEFREVPGPGQSGHSVIGWPQLWMKPVEAYLDKIGATAKR
jgi:dienelactone hydrolase